MTDALLRWGTIETPFAPFIAWVDADARLVRLLPKRRQPAGGGGQTRHDERAVAHVRRQIAEYCRGRLTVFDLALAAPGTPFQHRVWDALLDIPFGATTSYGEIARRIGQPTAARAVGLANGSNPIALVVPCHRVIGADGSLTGYAGGLPLKRALLRHEGVPA